MKTKSATLAHTHNPTAVFLTLVAVGCAVFFWTPQALAGIINEGTPLASDFHSNSGSLGCAGSVQFNAGNIVLATGVGGTYSHVHQAYGLLGCTPPPGADEQVTDGSYASDFEWMKATGTYHISVVWTVAARVVINASGANGQSCGRGALDLELNLFDEHNGVWLYSTTPVSNVFNDSFCKLTGTGTSTNLVASAQYNLTVSSGGPLTNGLRYDPESMIHIWTYVSGSADALVDCQSSTGQSNFIQFDSYNIW
jgi:hypothetical protein